MAGAVLATPGFDLQPSAQQVPTATNYITNFDFLNQYLPDTYEKEFERYGNRTISSFLRLVGAEMPSQSDQIKWAEQGRLHTKYTQVGTASVAGVAQAQFTVNDPPVPAGIVAPNSTTAATPFAAANSIAIRAGQTVMIVWNNGTGSNKAIVSAGPNDAGASMGATGATSFQVEYYDAAGQAQAGTGVGNSDVTVFIYGSEFQKGTVGMVGSLEADDYIFANNPIIIKDRYNVSGSDMAQI